MPVTGCCVSIVDLHLAVAVILYFHMSYVCGSVGIVEVESLFSQTAAYVPFTLGIAAILLSPQSG